MTARHRLLALMLSLLPAALFAQNLPVWQMQDAGTTASLRGIVAVNSNIAWASGTGGTVLRTLDGGQHWTHCATPDAARDGASLDFRGVQAWDEKTAIVMASGPGDQSRLYKTTDGCASWTLVLANPDKDGFWDAVIFPNGDYGFAIGDRHTGVLIGDPVGGKFQTRVMLPGDGWLIDDAGCRTPSGQSAFAASNSSVFLFGSRRYILGAGGKAGASVFLSPLLLAGVGTGPCKRIPVPMAGGQDSSGIFSLGFRTLKNGIAVGGDYTRPNEAAGTAAVTRDGGLHWTASEKNPHGYRSSVQWWEPGKLWIAVGTNGSDLSRDDGRTWQKLDDGNWNALGLPFVVGPHGRIARLQEKQ